MSRLGVCNQGAHCRILQKRKDKVRSCSYGDETCRKRDVFRSDGLETKHTDRAFVHGSVQDRLLCYLTSLPLVLGLFLCFSSVWSALYIGLLAIHSLHPLVRHAEA